MIREIGVELRAYLASQGCPVVVVDGPEPTKQATFGRERIVCERLLDQPEPVIAPQSQRRNPHMTAVRQIQGRLTIYAQEPRAGALPYEHLRRLDHIVDLVIVGLDKVLTARKSPFVLGPGMPTKADDVAASPSAGGAAFELRFTVDRGVSARTWAGTALSEVSMGGASGVVLASTTDAARQGDATNTEKACGA